MPESNIAETKVIYGRTNYINVTTNWQVLAINPTGSGQVHKINSVFVSNKDNDYSVDIDIRFGRIVNGVNTYFQLTRAITVPRDATLIAICRDNPAYLQEGDFIQVRAGTNSRADSIASYEIITETPGQPPSLTVPSAPLNLIGDEGNGSVTLYWDAPLANGGTSILDYVVQMSYRQSSNNAWSTFTTVTKPESDLRTFTITGLTNGWQYKFRVGALNAIGLGAWSDESSILSPTSLPAPGGVAATPYNASAVVTWNGIPSWQIPGGQTLTGYAIRWSVDDGQTWLPSVAGIPTNSTSAFRTMLNLTNNTPYIFSVRGVTDVQNGPWSTPSAAVVPLLSYSPPPINAANYNRSANWGGVTTGGNLLSVGTGSGPGVYGTYDMNGNVNEWLESRASVVSSAVEALTPGGSFLDNDAAYLNSDIFVSFGGDGNTPQFLSVAATASNVGFRLVSTEASPIVRSNNVFVDVGDAGNSGKGMYNNFYYPQGIGDVAYVYKIQKYEVSNAEYVDFLNAVDPSGANAKNLYDASMTNNSRGGINFVSGNPAGSKYAVKTDMAAKPVNFVSWYSCVRYANWMHNGCPTTGVQDGTTTENGAYEFASSTLSGTDDAATDFVNWAATPAYPDELIRKTGAKYTLPTTNEWYKAAFYKGGGTNTGYWTYATQSNTAPTNVTATATGVGVL